MTENDLEVFWGPDPLAAEGALERLASKGPDVIKELFPTDSNWPTHAWNSQARAIRLCKRLGPAIAQHLLHIIEHGDWHAKIAVSPCFSAFAGNHSIGEAIFRLLRSQDIDVQRIAIEALGHTAHSHGYSIAGMARYGRPDRVDRETMIDRYSMGKLTYYSVQALLRIFARTGDGSLLRQCRELVDDFGDVADNDFGWDIDHVMRELEPVGADALISEWLDGDSDKYRNHALKGLAHLRLRRTTPTLMRFIDREPTGVAAGIALGDMVHVELARRLAEAIGNGVSGAGVSWALSRLYALKVDWPDCSDLVSSMAQGEYEIAIQMRYSLAVRGDKSIVPRLERCLSGSDPFVRGASAIALARLLGADAEPLLTGRENETSSPIERVLVLTALIHLGRRELVGELDRAAQDRENGAFPILRPIWKHEVLAAFAAGDGKRAALWAEIAREDLGRALKDLETLGVNIMPASPAPAHPPAQNKGTSSKTKPSVFISYSRKDSKWLNKFKIALKPVERKGAIDLWDDTRMKIGSNWKEEIDLAMQRASVALLLASQNFLDSDFVIQHELKTLLNAAKTREVTIVWVAIDHALYRESELGTIAAANDPKTPLVDLPKSQQQKEIVRICEKIVEISKVS